MAVKALNRPKCASQASRNGLTWRQGFYDDQDLGATLPFVDEAYGRKGRKREHFDNILSFSLTSNEILSVRRYRRDAECLGKVRKSYDISSPYQRLVKAWPSAPRFSHVPCLLPHWLSAPPRPCDVPPVHAVENGGVTKAWLVQGTVIECLDTSCT